MSKALMHISKGFLKHPDGLSELRLISADSVRNLADYINNLSPDEIKEMNLVILLATGGTLAMETENGIRRPSLDWEDVFRPVNNLLHDRYKIVGLNIFCIDSSQMTYAHTREIAIILTYLWRNIKVPFLGFMITHGTDTMSYAGAAMSLMMGQGLPFSIVYVGAQRPIDDPMSDAPINLRNALLCLESLHAHDMAEVLIVMGERAMLATSAEKVDDTGINAFDAPRHSYVAQFHRLQYPVQLASWLNPRRRVPFEPTIWHGDYSHTLVIKSTMGLDPDLLKDQINATQIQTVILYSFGAGTVHEAVLKTVLETSQKRDIPVFIVNPVNSDYRAEYQSGAKAIEMGATPLNMTLSASLAKIEIALRMHSGDVQAMSRFMTSNYVGEVPTDRSGFTSLRKS